MRQADGSGGFCLEPKKKSYIWLGRLLIAGFFFSAILPILVIAAASITSVKQLAVQELNFTARQVVEHRQDVLDSYLYNQLLFFSTLLRLAPEVSLHSDQALQTLLQGMGEETGGSQVLGLRLRHAGDGRILAEAGVEPERFGGDSAALLTLSGARQPEQADYAIGGLWTDRDGRGLLGLTVSDARNALILEVIIDNKQLRALLARALVERDDAVFLLPAQSGSPQASMSVPNHVPMDEGPGQILSLAAVQGGAKSFRSADGWLYAAKKLEAASWLLVFKTRERDALAGYLRYRNGIAAIVAFTALLFLLFSIGASRSIVSRIRRSDQEQILLDQQLADMNRMAGIGKLAAGVAHEINNPLQLIQMQAGWMEGLLREAPDGAVLHREEYLSSVGKIREHVNRAATITRRLLGFSRKVDDARDADINALLQKTVSFVESDAYKNNVRLHLHLDPSLPIVRTDTSKVQQIMLNLLENALAAVGSDGRIDMSTTAVADEVRVYICDNGPGIAPELMEKIWQPFFTTKEEGRGTGLGLAICRDIAKKLGGSVSAENRPEGGAAFLLRLPRKER